MRTLRNQSPSGSGVGGIKMPYYLQSAMAFLAPYTKPRKQTSNLEEETEINVILTSSSNQVLESPDFYTPEMDATLLEETLPIPSDVEGDTSQISVDGAHCSVQKGNRKRKRESNKKDNFEEIASQYLQDKMQKRSGREEDKNEFILFFRSLLPDLNQMDRKFKQEVLKLIGNILEDE